MKNGSLVSIEFSIKLTDGTQVADNHGEEPLVYEVGAGQLPTALELRLSKLALGDKVQVTLNPEEAYGPVDEDAFRLVPTDMIPEDAREEGTPLTVENEDGSEQTVHVYETTDEGVVLDFNHPLAGETVTFDVKILDITEGED